MQTCYKGYIQHCAAAGHVDCRCRQRTAYWHRWITLLPFSLLLPVRTTQDALDLSQGFVKAMRAANIGASDKAAAASLEAANATAAANSSAPATVQAQDGPAASSSTAAMPIAGMLAEAMNVTRVGGLMANLPNLTNPITVIARVRDAVANSTAGAAAAAAARQPERRTTVRLNTAQDPSLPSWLNTGSPDATPAVYSR